MNIRISFIYMLLIFLSGCFASMPLVNNAYIKNIDESKKTDLNRIKQEIIAINKEIRALEKTADITEQKYKVLKRKLTVLEDKNPMLKEISKLYIITGENEKLAKSKSDFKTNKEDIKFYSIGKKYFDVKKDYGEAELDVKHSELAVKISEQELEKTLIISSMLSDSPAPKEGKGSKKAGTMYKNKPCKSLSRGTDVNACDITEHHEKRKKTLKKNLKALDKVRIELKKLEDKLKATGKTLEF